MQNEKMELQNANRIIEEKTQELKRNQERFVSEPDFVVKTARESGMVKPGETVFKFTNNQSEASSR